MASTLWRVIFIVGCFLYAAACLALASDGVSHWAAIALLAASAAHVVFGIDAVLQSVLLPRDQKKEIKRLRAELEAERLTVAALQERVTKLEEVRAPPGGGGDPPHTREKVTTED